MRIRIIHGLLPHLKFVKPRLNVFEVQSYLSERFKEMPEPSPSRQGGDLVYIASPEDMALLSKCFDRQEEEAAKRFKPSEPVIVRLVRMCGGRGMFQV
jgi:hypothetical protein